MAAVTGPPEQGPEIHIRELSVAAGGQLVVVLDGHLTCIACGYASATFAVDFSDQATRAKQRDHDPGE